MSTLVCLLEEASAGEMLKAILPKILPETTSFKIIAFDGKQDLEKKIIRRIQLWQETDSYFLVMRDQDSGDCMRVKQNLQKLVAQTGKADRTIIRIACHALESFYLGDLAAVEAGLALKGLSKQQRKSKFKNPDNLANATEELKKLSENTYSKIGGSRSIAPHLALDGSNKSRSFKALLTGIKKIVE